jgi:hypothetical protein
MNVKMISSWLLSQLRTPSAFGKFELYDVSEQCSLKQAVEQHLIRLLLEARINSKMLQEAAKVMGWKRVEELLVKPTQPTLPKKRLGDFGEVLTNALLTEVYQYTIPVQKLQFGVSDEQSQPGTDAIAIKKSGSSISEMCYVESKLRTKNDAYSCLAAVQGYQQLKSDYSEKVPDMISFILARLYDSKDPLFFDFLNYINNRQNMASIDRLKLGLVWERDKWREETLESLEEEVDDTLPKLSVYGFRIQGLKSTVERLYEKMGVDVIHDEQ